MANYLDVGLRLSLNRTALADAKAGMKQISGQLQQLRNQVVAFAGAYVSFRGLQQLSELADQYRSLNARLKLVSATTREYVAAQQEVFAIAQRTGTPLEATVALYARMTPALREAGRSQREGLEITEAVSQALAISGASAEEASSSILQFSQALASGRLGGDEFRSLGENAPRLMRAVADGLNVPLGKLKELSREGKLTTDVIINALLSQRQKLASEYSQLPETVGRALERVKNQFLKSFGELDQRLGASSSVAEALNAIARNMKIILDGLAAAVVVLAAALARNLVLALNAATVAAIQNAIANRAAASAAAEMGIAIKAAVPWAMRLSQALNALFIGIAAYQFGSWLRENFKIARDAGYYFVQGVMIGLERLRQAFLSIKPGLILAWTSTMDRLREIAADFYDSVAAIFEKLPGEMAANMARSMRDAAAEIRSSIGHGGAGAADAELARIAAETKARIAAIDEPFKDLRSMPLGEGEARVPPSDERGKPPGAAGGGEKELAKRMKAELDRAQAELEQALRRRQITEQQYYEARADLIAIAHDKDVIAQREAMDKLNADLAAGLEARADRIAQGLARREERIARDLQLGRIGQGEARERTSKERARARDELDELIAAAAPLEDILGEETLRRLRDIKDELGSMKTPIQELGEELKSSLQDPLADAFATIIRDVRRTKEAFQDFGRAVIDIIIRIIAQKLAAQVVGGLGFANGGRVGGYANGGFVRGPGGPKDDRIPALLSNGEYVLSAAAVRRWGQGFLDWLNDPVGVTTQLRTPAVAYASGGMVRAISHAKPQIAVNVTSYVDARRATDPAEVAAAVERGRQQTLADVADLVNRNVLETRR